MSISAGTKLGPYEILSPLGAGGMGEVYRAKDTRVDRAVALKVLPEEFFESEERRGRFEREARMLASLNHPGIATLFSFEEISGRHVLSMELIEGEDLAQRIASAPLPLEESLAYARQIADALEAAHEKGIVHRDLKPANVKVTPDGRVKLLDFGLAKIFEGDSGPGSSPAITKSPTLTARATAAGVILGTAAYMSPEQARGKPVDKRTDVWAFGCVLYEMLAGRRAFEGETVTDVLAAVLTREPDWSALRGPISSKVSELLRRCLQRDQKQRLRDIGDARIVLEEETAASASRAGQLPFEENAAAPDPAAGRNAPAMFARGSRTSLSSYFPWVLAAAFAAAAGALALRARAPQPAPAIRGQVLLSSEELMDGVGASVVVAPDGTRLAYVTRGARPRLFLRALDRLQPVEVPESEGAVGPFFSPDGKWVAFFAGGKLRKAAVSGGVPATICDATIPRGGAWVSDDTIVFAPRSVGGLMVVPASGGEPKILTKVDVAARERSHRWPAPLPGGKAVLFMTQLSGGDYDDGVIETVEVSTGKRSVIHKGGSFPRWSPSGHVLFARKGSIYAAPFDPGRPGFTGRPIAVLEKIMSSTGGEAPSDGSAQIDVSASGFCAYRTGEAETLFTLALVDRRGVVLRKTSPPRGYSWTRFSPDGTRAAIQISGPSQSDIWVYDIARDTLSKLTFEGDNLGAVWSPDGRDVVFGSDRDRELVARPGGSAVTLRGLYRKRADGSGPARLLFKFAGLLSPTGLSPDGRALAFQVSRPETQMDVGVIRLRGDVAEGEPEMIVAGPANEGGGLFSPDGRWLAYESNDGGLGYVYLRSAAGGDAKWQVSDQMGSSPRWSRDGTLYFVRRQDASVVATRVTAEGGAPVFGKEERLVGLSSFEAGSQVVAGWDVSPDGQKFLTLLREGAANTPDVNHVTLASDFAEELRRLAPAGTK
ncbi:MAG TPA: protein kinase [Thermoanaerobaculia bacterium]